ncbi:MAG TPA: FAD-binding oxidoreductase [Candidatus Nanoarchaeia archaeon]|nr:FAD-binding oxidoreductase [Candidatus Nanoarchaeia archaeon]
MLRDIPATVSEVFPIGAGSKCIRMQTAQQMPYAPGQFMMIRCEMKEDEEFKIRDGKKPVQQRAFSVSSSPLNTAYLEFTAKPTENAFFSDYLARKVSVGHPFFVSGPFGHFFYQDEMQDIVLLGAGSGIAPLLGIMRYIRDKRLQAKAHLIYSNKTEQDILWRQEIEGLSGGNISHLFTLTQQQWEGSKGRIDAEMMRKHVHDATVFFLCGPMPFVQEMERILAAEFQVPKERVKKEIYD